MHLSRYSSYYRYRWKKSWTHWFGVKSKSETIRDYVDTHQKNNSDIILHLSAQKDTEESSIWHLCVVWSCFFVHVSSHKLFDSARVPHLNLFCNVLRFNRFKNFKLFKLTGMKTHENDKLSWRSCTLTSFRYVIRLSILLTGGKLIVFAGDHTICYIPLLVKKPL